MHRNSVSASWSSSSRRSKFRKDVQRMSDALKLGLRKNESTSSPSAVDHPRFIARSSNLVSVAVKFRRLSRGLHPGFISYVTLRALLCFLVRSWLFIPWTWHRKWSGPLDADWNKSNNLPPASSSDSAKSSTASASSQPSVLKDGGGPSFERSDCYKNKLKKFDQLIIDIKTWIIHSAKKHSIIGGSPFDFWP